MTHLDPGPLSWAIDSRDSTTTLTLRGELDFAAVLKSKDALIGEVTQTDGSVVVDLSELAFIDSSGMRLLLDLKVHADRRGRRFRLGGASAPVARALEVSGVAVVFDGSDGSQGARS